MSRLLAAQRAWTVPGWVKDLLWRRAQAIPSLDLRFADNKSLVDAVTGASLITFARAYSGTYVDSAGVLQTAAIDVPRFDHNPTTGESLGLLVEEQRTNLLLNSGTLSTQSVTVTAAAHTLSFTGTGTITLTGTSTAGPLVGTGTGEANRVSLTFTPTAGSLTLTVSGTVTNAQLEAGAFRTSYIATAGAQATRSADLADIMGANFTNFFTPNRGTFLANWSVLGEKATTESSTVVSLGTADNNNYAGFFVYDNRTNVGFQRPLGANTSIFNNLTGQKVKSATAFNDASTNNTSAVSSINGVIYNANLSDNYIVSGANLVFDRLGIGRQSRSVTYFSPLNGTIARLSYWPQPFSESTLQLITF